MKKITDQQRLAKFLKAAPTGCLLFSGSRNADGYGYFCLNGKNRYAHRVAYEFAYGSIPDGMEIDHTCFEPACCNPAHLRALPPKENHQLQRKAFKTICKNGHPLTEENVYRAKVSGHRHCRRCNLQSVRKYQSRLQSAEGAT